MPFLQERVRGWAQHVSKEYSGGTERPLGGYIAVFGVYSTLTAAAVAVGRARGVRLPPRISGADLALLGVATHKLSRMVAKDPVLSPLRAPFTRFEGVSGEAELSEAVRGHGVQHAVGELLTCPFCLAQWVGTALVGGLVFAPRFTRLLSSAFAVKAVADAAQLAYAGLQKATTS